MLSVAVFFIGIGSIIEKTGAKFKSDEKALEIINRARLAIGGDANLRGVQSLTIVGRTTHLIETPDTQDIKGGTLEINMQFPGQFSKSVQIGDPADAASGIRTDKQVDVIIMHKDGETADFKAVDGAATKGVFVIKKDAGTGEVEDVRVEGDKIIVTETDGSVEELNADGPQKHKVIVRKNSDEPNSWTTEDGKMVVLEKGLQTRFAVGGIRQNELLRTAMSLLLTTPEGLDVTYKFVGQGNVDGAPSNIIEVSSNGSAFKLHIDAATSLPRMISYVGPSNIIHFNKKSSGEVSSEQTFEFKRDIAEPVEHQIRFSDFRSVDGLLLPYRWSETVGGRQHQTIDITSYAINPANIADKFNKQKIFVRKTDSLDK
jgi:hypothetical protein